MNTLTKDISQGKPEQLDVNSTGSESPSQPSAQVGKLSAAEQILAGVQNLPSYFPSAFLYPNSFAQLQAMNNRQDMEKFTRSMTSLGLAHTIPEEPNEIDEENPLNLISSNKIGSKSAIDFAGFGEEDIFGVNDGVDYDKRNMDYGGYNIRTGDQATPTPPLPQESPIPLQASIPPTRTIIISNVPSSLPDENLKMLFQTFGEIQSLRTDYKMHNIVLVSFYDIRSAQNARQQLNGVALGNQLLNVQYSAPISASNFGEGLVLLYNVESFLDSQKLASVMSTYGEVKSIREVPDKENYKLVEFYDIRHATAALQDINKAIFANKNSESQEGEGRMRQAASMQHLSSALSMEQKDVNFASQSWDGSADIADRMKLIVENRKTPTSHGPSWSFDSSSGGFETSGNMTKSLSVGCSLSNVASGLSGNNTSPLHNQPSSLPVGGAIQLTPSLAKTLNISDIASNSQNVASLLDSRSLGRNFMNTGGSPMQNAQESLLQKNMASNMRGIGGSAAGGYGNYPLGYQNQQPQQNHSGLLGLSRSGLSYSASVGSGLDIYGQQNPMAQNLLIRNLAQQASNYQNINSPTTSSLNPFQGYLTPAIVNSNPNLASHFSLITQANSANLGQVLQSQTNSGAGVSDSGSIANNASSSNNNIYEALVRLREAGITDIPSYLAQNNNSQLNASSYASLTQQLLQKPTSSVISSLPSPGMGHKSASSPSLNLACEDSHHRRGGGGRLSRGVLDPMVEAERRQQQQRLYALDIDKIRNGEDKRTTLMIKNIPNKYTQKMLLASVDETLRGRYDFFYLPIDFKNKCNVGYGFINMREPVDIIPVVERFHNRKWDRFNSEKICNVAYARIQGKQALINHFQNSSLMHEDKKHRPVLFVTDGPNKGEPEVFPVGPNVRPKITIKERDFRSRERSSQWN